MGAMLSLPVIGSMMGYFLMGPTLGTYSTSLNLLFFYLTWSTLVLSQPPLRVEIIGTLAVRVLFFVAPSLILLLFDTLVPTLAVQMKTQGAAALPTRTGGLRVSKSRSKPPWYSVIGLSLFNVCLGVAIQAGVELFFTAVLNIRSALKVTTTLPMPWSIAKDVARGLILREIIQYYTHRFLLHPRSQNFLSSLHNNFFHSITAPYAFATHYDHPLPYIIFRFLPTYLPSLIFRDHLLTYLLLLSIITIEETLALSGNSAIPGIMFSGIARRQDLHSQSRGKGNFAPWGILDWIHGTGIGADVLDDLKDEADKHNIKERSSNSWNNAKKSGREGLMALNGKKRGGRKT